MTGLHLVLALAMLNPAPAKAGAGSARDVAMVRLPAAEYLPFYGDGRTVRVNAFELDVLPVTRAQYLAFVRANPVWQRSAVRRGLADARYLENWVSDVDIGRDRERVPVTNVSWFAARAYCAWVGKRLPTTDEWEFAAAASEHARDATRDAAFRQRLIEIYTRPLPPLLPQVGSGFRNIYGVSDLHGFVREWVADFTAVTVSDDARDAGEDRQLYCAAGASRARDPNDYAAFLRYALRASLNGRSALPNVGFRCARSS